MPFQESTLKLEQIPLGEGRCVAMGELQIGVFNHKDGLFAIDNICPHRGAPLHDGMIIDGKVTCPWHQWQFQLDDGVCTNIPKVRIASYPVEVRDGTIWIDPEDQGAK